MFLYQIEIEFDVEVPDYRQGLYSVNIPTPTKTERKRETRYLVSKKFSLAHVEEVWRLAEDSSRNPKLISVAFVEEPMRDHSGKKSKT